MAESWVEVSNRSYPVSFKGDGTQDFISWRQSLEDNLDARFITEPKARANYLKLHLDGMARDRFKQLTDGEQADYAKAIKKLENFFVNQHSKKHAKLLLKRCTQLKGESVAAFAARLGPLVRSATAGQPKEARDELLLDSFVDSLRPELSFHVQLRLPKKFADAYELALSIEGIQPTAFLPQAEVNATHTAPQGSVEQRIDGLVKLMGRLYENQLDILEQLNASSAPECPNCGYYDEEEPDDYEHDDDQYDTGEVTGELDHSPVEEEDEQCGSSRYWCAH